MRVLICGGRDFSNYHFFEETMNNLSATYLIETIISGGAKGADSFAILWAGYNNYSHNDIEVYAANWDKYGKSAGYKRNIQMLEEGKPDLVVAFPGGKGTAMMIDLAEKAGVKVIKVKYDQS